MCMPVKNAALLAEHKMMVRLLFCRNGRLLGVNERGQNEHQGAAQISFHGIIL